MRGPVTKTCEHCKQAFECCGYQCWCGKVGITEQQMDWIAARFHDCLCPACLKMVGTGAHEAFSIKPVSPTGAE